jgi:integrase
MKMRAEHKVPLSMQAISILEQLRLISGSGTYVFPAQGKRDRTLSENTINGALRRMGSSGDEVVGHGFRATASTIMNEAGNWHPDTIERALAHRDANKIRAIYNRAEHWNERVQLAQWCSDNLDELRGHPTSLMPVHSSVRA